MQGRVPAQTDLITTVLCNSEIIVFDISTRSLKDVRIETACLEHYQTYGIRSDLTIISSRRLYAGTCNDRDSNGSYGLRH